MDGPLCLSYWIIGWWVMSEIRHGQTRKGLAYDSAGLLPVNMYTILFLLDRPFPECKGLSGTWCLVYPPLCSTAPKILSPLYAWDQVISLEFLAFIQEFNCPFQCRLWLVGNWTLFLYFDLLFLELWFPHLDWSRNDLPIILFPCLEIVSRLETSWAVSWAIHCIMPFW